MTSLKSQAIHTALSGDWNTAVLLNQELLKQDPDDIDTLNRLAFAFTVLGKIKHAKITYQKVLKIDNQNLIALKNLKRLSKGNKKTVKQAPFNPQFSTHLDTMFLEETGKTKVIELINIADPKIISTLITGELLNLRIKRLKIFVLNTQEKYIGMLPDDIGKRLIKFLKGGNEYEAYIKAVDSHHVAIFIKEIKRTSRFKNQPSFISNDKSHLLFDKTANNLRNKHFSVVEDDDAHYSSEDDSL